MPYKIFISLLITDSGMSMLRKYYFVNLESNNKVLRGALDHDIHVITTFLKIFRM